MLCLHCSRVKSVEVLMQENSTMCVLNVHCPLSRERATPLVRVEHTICKSVGHHSKLVVLGVPVFQCSSVGKSVGHHSKLVVDGVLSSAVPVL